MMHVAKARKVTSNVMHVVKARKVTYPSGPEVWDVSMTEVRSLCPSSPRKSARPCTFWLSRRRMGKWSGLASCQSAMRPKQLAKVTQDEP